MRRESRWSGRHSGRFPAEDADPLANVASLVDVMLVFACGLIAALVAGKALSPDTPAEEFIRGGIIVEKERELPTVPQSMKRSGQGEGLETVGTVYRDPRTGKLVLVGE